MALWDTERHLECWMRSMINSHKINRISRGLFEKVWRIIDWAMYVVSPVCSWPCVWCWGKNCLPQLPVCRGGVNNVLMSRLCLSLLCLQLPPLHWYRVPSATPAPLLDSPGNRENSLRGKIVGFWKELSDLTVGLHWLSGGKILPVLLRCKTGQYFNIFRLLRQGACARRELTECAQWWAGSHPQTSRHFSRPGGLWGGARPGGWRRLQTEATDKVKAIYQLLPLHQLGMATQHPHRKLFHQKIFLKYIYVWCISILSFCWLTHDCCVIYQRLPVETYRVLVLTLDKNKNKNDHDLLIFLQKTSLWSQSTFS